MIHPCYCISLRKVSRRLTAMYDEAFAPLGITAPQFSQMQSIRRRQPVSLTELAIVMELDRSTVGRNAKLLHRMGLVHMIASTEDQRETVLNLTDAAVELLERATPIWKELQARVEGKLEGLDFARVMVALNDV